MEPELSAIPEGDPFDLFQQWLDEAKQAEPNDHNAMALATADDAGRPSCRMVLLKGHGAEGFTFYTNSQSRKGADILANPQAALLFHWKSLRRQIRIEGALHEVSAAMADAYFASRSPVSQIGSAASDQSRPLEERQDYLDRVEALERQYGEGGVPRPAHWTGFTLVPDRIEFWLDRPYRLHDRRQFNRVMPKGSVGDGGGWESQLLYP